MHLQKSEVPHVQHVPASILKADNNLACAAHYQLGAGIEHKSRSTALEAAKVWPLQGACGQPRAVYGMTRVQGLLECLSHIRRLTRMVRTLQTLPMTENEVAEMTARRAKEK